MLCWILISKLRLVKSKFSQCVMLRHSTVGKNKPRQNDDFLYNDICIFSCNFFLVLSKLGAKFENFRLFFCAPRNIRCSSSLQSNIFAVLVCVCFLELRRGSLQKLFTMRKIITFFHALLFSDVSLTRSESR